MRNKRLLSAVAAAGLLAASAASAANYEISNVGFAGGTANLSGTINSNPFGESALTGLILLTTSGGQTIPVFCIDLFHTIGLGSYNPPLPYTTGAIVADSSSSPAGNRGQPARPSRAG